MGKVAKGVAGVGILGAIATAVIVEVSKDKIKEVLGDDPKCTVFGHVYEAQGRPLPVVWVQIHKDWRATQPGGGFRWEGECAGVEGSSIRFSRGGIACPLQSKSVAYKVGVELPLTVDLDQLESEACADKKTVGANSNTARSTSAIEQRDLLIGSWRQADSEQWAIVFLVDGSWRNTKGEVLIGTGSYAWIADDTVKLSFTQEGVPQVMEWRIQIDGDVLQTADAHSIRQMVSYEAPGLAARCLVSLRRVTRCPRQALFRAGALSKLVSPQGAHANQ